MDALSLATAIIHHILGMAWKVGWGLVLGFAISGAIQGVHLQVPDCRASG